MNKINSIHRLIFSLNFQIFYEIEILKRKNANSSIENFIFEIILEICFLVNMHVV